MATNAIQKRYKIPFYLFFLFLVLVLFTLVLDYQKVNLGISSGDQKVNLEISSFGQKWSDYDEKRLCEENFYSNTLSLNLSNYGELMDDWISKKIQNEKRLTKQTRGFAHDWKRFDAFEVMGSCTQKCIGGECKKDTSKIVCLDDNLVVSQKSSRLLSSAKDAAKDNEEPPCIIYSIGGNNHWEFELDALSKTPCDIHTFDCTGDITRFKKPDSRRLHFHYVCLGIENKPAQAYTGEFWTLKKIQQVLSHPRIDLLKMDIEGYEWSIFESWPLLTEKESSSTTLPMQIMVEIHYQTQMKELGTRKIDFKFSNDMIQLQTRFLKMGYAVVIRDDNAHCKHCTELTLVRIRCPQPTTLW